MYFSVNKFVFIFLALYSTSVLSGNDPALNAFKEHSKTQEIIKTNAAIGNKMEFHSMPISGQCGVVGCGWIELVSIIITTKGVNPNTSSYTAFVFEIIPGDSKPVVKFINLHNLIK